MKEDADSNQQELRSHGLKSTLPRLRVLELFQTSTERHLSADEVYRLLSQNQADIGLTTVYRVLSQLEAAGLLTRTGFQPERAIYELNDGRHHDHLVCTACGRVEEFEERIIEKRQQEVAESRGFRLVEHALYLYGICSECRKLEDEIKQEGKQLSA